MPSSGNPLGLQPLIALDQGINTLVYLDGDGWGMADETLSARAWRLRHLKGGMRAVKIINFRNYVATAQ